MKINNQGKHIYKFIYNEKIEVFREFNVFWEKILKKG